MTVTDTITEESKQGWAISGTWTWGIGLMPPYGGEDFLNKHGIGIQLHLIIYAITIVYWFKQ